MSERPSQRLSDLPARMQEVLLAVLEHYVDDACPVSSQVVAKRFTGSVSSATVRSTMAVLMDQGLLEQKHTSAGRIPTEQAFRLYVDDLLLRHVESEEIPLEWDNDLNPLDASLRSAADFLSRLTGQLGFFLAPDSDQLRIRHLHFLRVSSERVMALLVSHAGTVQRRVIDESETDQTTLDRVSLQLTQILEGCTLREARSRLVSNIEVDRERRDALWRHTLELGRAGLAPERDAAFYVADRHFLLRHPEFSDIERLRDVLATLEEKQRMMALLEKLLAADVVRVTIGTEIAEPRIRECAVVTAPLGEAGGIGVIGPVRMRYDQVIPAVRLLSARVGRYIS